MRPLGIALLASALALPPSRMLNPPVPRATGSVEGTVRAQGGSLLAGASVSVEGTILATITDARGNFRFDSLPAGRMVIRARMIGMKSATATVTVSEGAVTRADLTLVPDPVRLDEVVVTSGVARAGRIARQGILMRGPSSALFNTEEYHRIYENGWATPLRRPLSTFSIDVDAASYTNIRRFVADGRLPPEDAVRIEEMVNYFPYDYPEPAGAVPFSVTTELAAAPWHRGHRLALIGLQSKRLALADLPPNNLVFLLDVSGSMDDPRKLPLVKAAFRLLVNQLRPEDRVAIVVYAGAAGLVLPSTAGDRKEQILDAIERLSAGGSTAGAEGIRLAYDVARKNFLREGTNRVILATDGDFNVGVSSDGELIRLIEQERESGVSLTVLGFGTGNLKDSKMEQLADKGNGHYAYVNDLLEARKVFVRELGATLLTVAKDVKLQVEFNPARVAAYRLIGYENRLLADEDFANDAKDAGDLGAGHSVTALYEIVPTGMPLDVTLGSVDSLKYQRPAARAAGAASSGEWMTVKLRYKPPAETASRLLAATIREETRSPSETFRFAAAVAGVGLLLRHSEYAKGATYGAMIALARGARGEDVDGYRGEFLRLAETIGTLAGEGRKVGANP